MIVASLVPGANPGSIWGGESNAVIRILGTARKVHADIYSRSSSAVVEFLEFLAGYPIVIKDTCMFQLRKHPRTHDLASAHPCPVLMLYCLGSKISFTSPA